MSLEQLTEKVRSKVADGGIEETVKFDCGDAGVILLKGTTVTNENEEADCTISISPDNLDSLLDGDLNPTMAFMTGKISVEGDMSVAMKLGSVV